MLLSSTHPDNMNCCCCHSVHPYVMSLIRLLQMHARWIQSTGETNMTDHCEDLKTVIYKLIPSHLSDPCVLGWQASTKLHDSRNALINEIYYIDLMKLQLCTTILFVQSLTWHDWTEVKLKVASTLRVIKAVLFPRASSAVLGADRSNASLVTKIHSIKTKYKLKCSKHNLKHTNVQYLPTFTSTTSATHPRAIIFVKRSAAKRSDWKWSFVIKESESILLLSPLRTYLWMHYARKASALFTD